MTSPSRVPPVTPADVLEVWFDGTDLGVAPRSELQRRWFMPDPAFDAELTTLFSALFDDLDAVEAWADTPAGALAAIVVFDQVSRNLFRGGARAFATDPRARRLAARVLQAGWDRPLSAAHRAFVYLPFEHGESIADQDQAVALFGALVREATGADRTLARFFLDFAEKHRAVIVRFGRFPGRNRALGRPDTVAEIEYLTGGGETWGQGAPR